MSYFFSDTHPYFVQVKFFHYFVYLILVAGFMHSQRKICWLLLLPLLVPLCMVAQTSRIDSLKKELQLHTSEQDKLKTLLNLCREQSSFSPDTLYRYALNAKSIALSQQDGEKIALADYFIGIQYLTRGRTDSCLAITDRYLKQLHYTATEKEGYVNFILLKARSLNYISKPKEALDLLYPLLTTAEKKEDTLIQTRTMNAMVGPFVSASDDKQAQKWCYKALQMYPKPLTSAYQESFGITLNNIILTYLHLYENAGKKQLLDSANYYTGIAISSNTQNEYLGNLAYCLGLKGTILGMTNKIAEGEQLLKESLATYRQTGNQFYIINAMAVLGNFYGLSKQPQKGIAICKEGIELGKASSPNIFLYLNLAGNYKQAGEYRLYGETMEKIFAIKDSLYKKNSAEALSELQTRYEMQKKENTIIQQNYALAKKNYLAYGSLALLFIGGIFFIILIRLNRKKQEFKFQAIQREEKRLNEIAVSTAEENERRRIAAELHDNLGGQLSYISSNMDFILEAPASLTEEEKKNHLSRVNDTAKSTIADLRESIWALKKQQVEMDELADKIKLFAQNQLSHQVGIQLEVHENILRKTVLSSAEALNIFRIFQEAINNALKYSGASKIILSIETNNLFAYNLSIADNGKGFDTNVALNDHYGIENMQQRSKDIHAILNINSKPHDGTAISLSKAAE